MNFLNLSCPDLFSQVLGLGWIVGFSFYEGQEFCCVKIPDQPWIPTIFLPSMLLGPFARAKSNWSMRLTFHFHLVLKNVGC